MGSQLDLDQGGTFRQYQKVWLGPSIGWMDFPVTAILLVNAAGTFAIQRATNFIQLSVAAGVVNINLPSSKAGVAQALPGQSVQTPTIITDILGTAGAAATINVNANGTELISGLASVQLASPFGTLLLNPNLSAGGWTLGQ